MKSVRSKIVPYRTIKKITAIAKQEGKIIVFKTGCFDIFHIAHARMLSYAKKKGDILVVGVGSDKTLKTLKGPTRPLFPEHFRAELIASLSFVDYVVILKEPLIGRIDHEKILSLVRPHYYLLPPDDKALAIKKKMAKKYDVAIILKRQMQYSSRDISSTELVKKLQEFA